MSIFDQPKPKLKGRSSVPRPENATAKWLGAVPAPLTKSKVKTRKKEEISTHWVLFLFMVVPL